MQEIHRAIHSPVDSVKELLQVAGGTKRNRLTTTEFNPLARAYLEEHATKEHRVKARELANHLKGENPAGTCSLKTIGRLPAWQAYQDALKRSGRKSRKTRPRAVSLTPKLETIVVDDDELQRLTGEQTVDRRTVKIRKRV
jgi:hypothetical protein